MNWKRKLCLIQQAELPLFWPSPMFPHPQSEQTNKQAERAWYESSAREKQSRKTCCEFIVPTSPTDDIESANFLGILDALFGFLFSIHKKIVKRYYHNRSIERAESLWGFGFTSVLSFCLFAEWPFYWCWFLVQVFLLRQLLTTREVGVE